MKCKNCNHRCNEQSVCQQCGWDADEIAGLCANCKPSPARKIEALNETAMVAHGVRHYELCSAITGGAEMPCVRCQRDESRRLLERAADLLCIGVCVYGPDLCRKCALREAIRAHLARGEPAGSSISPYDPEAVAKALAGGER